MNTRQFRILTILTVLAVFLGGAIYELYAIRAAIDELKTEIIPIRQAVQGYGGTPDFGLGIKSDVEELKSDVEELKSKVDDLQVYH